MKIGRNDPCPCASGKKYKKCCLAKDEARELEFRQGIQAENPVNTEPPWEAPAPDPSPDEFPSQDDAEAEADEDLEIASEAEPLRAREYPQVDETLPELSPVDQALVDKWWDDVKPSFDRRDTDEMLRWVESFLETHPALFPHLWLNAEYLFELGAELGRRQQWPVYASLLERLRREQPKAYSFSFGDFDYDLIIEKIVSNRLEEIAPCLSFFQEYPDSHPDQCHALTNLLAWRGLESPLYELAEAVAVPLLTSREVINGGFAMEWLITREVIPFLEARKESESAAATVMDRLHALAARLDYQLTPTLPSVQGRLKMSAASPTVMELNQYKPRDSHFLDNLEWNFMGYLRAHQPVNWVQARFAAERLDSYVWWHGGLRKDPFQFKPAEVERCLAQTCKSFLWIDGVRLIASLQMVAWFADYLKAAGGISEVKRQQVRELSRTLFEKGRQTVDSTDPAYRLYPTFEQLAPEAAEVAGG